MPQHPVENATVSGFGLPGIGWMTLGGPLELLGEWRGWKNVPNGGGSVYSRGVQSTKMGILVQP